MKNLFITIPAFGLHGGIRVIIELANRLTKYYNVHLHSLNGLHNVDYWSINEKVKIVDSDMSNMDILLITSPHSIDFGYRVDTPNNVFVHLQMMEHLFNNSIKWHDQCKRLYTTEYPIMSISEWNIERLTSVYKRQGITHYIGNGVNTDDFEIKFTDKDFKTVLVEGLEPGNPAKDTDRIGSKVALKLKREGYDIIAYGQTPPKLYGHVPCEFHQSPSLEKLNELYERATILLKASKYDARSCSPIEAATKGTVTARAIINGDDDLINNVNCLKVGYSEQSLYKAAKKLLTDKENYYRLQSGLKDLLKQNDWDIWIKKIHEIISN